MRNGYGHLEPQMDQIGFTNHLQNMAFCFYDTDTYQPYPHFTEALEYEKLTHESLDRHGFVQKSSSVTDWLTSKNIVEIAQLRRGEATILAAPYYRGQGCHH